MPNYLSTTGVSKACGLTPKPLVFDFLLAEGYLSYEDRRYKLTSKGEKYGHIFHRGEEKWVVWDEEKISPILLSIKLEIMNGSKMNSKLYHMTHIDNLPEIMRKGLFSHNSVGDYVDISNAEVNIRRQAEEPIFHNPIHNYVPLYFNVRNAMLYRVQKDYRDRVIILEFDSTVCLLKNVLFTYNNAASSSAVFYSCIKKFIDDDNWDNINQRSWIDDYDAKQAMMSECLILDRIDQSLIKNIHCMNEKTLEEIDNILNETRNITVDTIYYNSELFF